MPLIAKTFRLEESTVTELKRVAPNRSSTPNQTEIVESAVRERLGLTPKRGSAPAPPKDASPAASQAAPAELPAEPSIELPAWLQGKTGMPKSACRMAVVRGQVKVNGEVWEPNVRVPLRLLSRGVEAFGETYLP